jgi:hypothetical protein
MIYKTIMLYSYCENSHIGQIHDCASNTAKAHQEMVFSLEAHANLMHLLGGMRGTRRYSKASTATHQNVYYLALWYRYATFVCT